MYDDLNRECEKAIDPVEAGRLKIEMREMKKRRMDLINN